MDRALWFVMDAAARFKLPRVRVMKVAIDGVTGGHLGLVVGSYSVLLTLSWAKRVAA